MPGPWKGRERRQTRKVPVSWGFNLLGQVIGAKNHAVCQDHGHFCEK